MTPKRGDRESKTLPLHPVDLVVVQAAGVAPSLLDRAATYQAWRNWIRWFAPGESGEPAKFWEFFLRKRTAARQGVRALREYLVAPAETLIVIAAEPGFAAFELSSLVRPDYSSASVDRYVMDAQGAWSIVFPHHDALGPWLIARQDM